MRTETQTLGYQRNSDTSEQAAGDARQGAAQRRAAVYARIAQSGEYGCTADELRIYFHCAANSVAPRVSELKKARRIADSGKRRITRQGSKAAVYVTADRTSK